MTTTMMIAEVIIMRMIAIESYDYGLAIAPSMVARSTDETHHPGVTITRLDVFDDQAEWWIFPFD